MAIMTTSQPEGITFEQRFEPSEQMALDVDSGPTTPEFQAVEISPSNLKEAPTASIVQANGVAHNDESFATNKVAAPLIESQLTEASLVSLGNQTSSQLLDTNTTTSDALAPSPELQEASLSVLETPGVELKQAMESAMETVVTSALADTTATSTVPPVIEVPESDLRDTESALVLSPVPQNEPPPPLDPQTATENRLPLRSVNEEVGTAESDSIPSLDTRTADSEPSLPAPLPKETSSVDQDQTLSIEVEQATTAKDDAEMTDALEPATFTKVPREREEDNDDAPSAKRTKTESDAAMADVSDQDAQASSAVPPVVQNENATLIKPELETTTITDHEIKEIIKILKTVVRRKDGMNFRGPVAELWPALAESYYAIVPHPVDFVMMERGLKEHKYATMADFKADVNHLHENAVLYNGPGHTVTASAKTVRDTILEKMSNMPPESPAKPAKILKKERKTTPTKDPAPRAARRQSKSGGAAGTTFALDPNTSTPLIRRDSTKGDGGRPKREIHAPNKDLPYSTATRPKNKKATQELRFCEDVLNEMKKPKYASHANPFMLPVDPVSLQIPTYFNVIKHPMDFSTVEANLKAGQYPSAKAFESDVRLIFANCYKFNPAGNVVNQLGKQTEAVFNDVWAGKTKWLADHAPAPQTSSSNGGSDDDESEEEAEVEEPASSSNSIAALSERLTEEMAKMIEMMKNPKMDRQLVEVQQAMIDILQKKITDAKTKPAPKKVPKKPKAAKPPKKQAVQKKSSSAGSKKSGRSRSKYLGSHEKNVISSGIGKLPEEITQIVLSMIKAEAEVDEGDDGEVELDIDAISPESLWKIYEYVMVHAPEVDGEVRAQFDDGADEPDTKPAKPPAKKKNKPMSKVEQERKIQLLEGNIENFQKRNPSSQEPLQTVERHQDVASPADESSGDESDSEEE